MFKRVCKYLLISVIEGILNIQKGERAFNKDYNPRDIQNILIYASMGIGDFLLFTPSMKAIREAFPKANITLLLNNRSDFREIIKGSKLIDETVSFSRNESFIKKILFLKEMRNSRFNLLINAFWTDDIYLALISIVCNIPFRAGYCSSDEWKSKYEFLYNIKINFGSEHEIDRGLRFIHALGIRESYIEKNPIIHIEEKDELFAQNFIIDNNLNGRDLLIGINPGAALHQKWKIWDIEKFSELCERLVKFYKVKIIIFGSKEEAKLAEYIKEKVQQNIIIATGKTSIKEAAALIKRCNLFVCNDSGLMHVSAAVNTTVIAIYGPTDPGRTAPFGDNHVLVRKDLPCSPCFKPGNSTIAENCPNEYECLKSITPDEVFKIIGQKIEQIKGINHK